MTNVIVIFFLWKGGKVRMCVETRRRSRAGGKGGGGGYEVIFLYGKEYLSLSEMLEREDILRYLRRNGRESSDSALRKRLLKGLHRGSITKEVVTNYAKGPKPVLAPRAKPVTTPVVKPVPLPRTLKSLMRPIPPPRTKPSLIPRKIMSKLRPTSPPRKRKEKPVPPPRTRNVKPVPPPRTRNVKPIPPPRECEHGTTEEIHGVIFCIRCGLEIDHNPLREGLVRERECQAFHVPSRKNPIFKRRTGPKKPKEEYIPVSPSEVSLLARKDKKKEIKDQILGYLGLLDEN